MEPYCLCEQGGEANVQHSAPYPLRIIHFNSFILFKDFLFIEKKKDRNRVSDTLNSAPVAVTPISLVSLEFKEHQ